MMFKFFKTPGEHVEEVMKDIKESAYVTPAKLPAECHYTVGTDSDGSVVLRVGGTINGTTTLTMNDVGTRQLIRMLEAALPEDETEEVR